MNPIEAQYRNHKIVIRDVVQFANDRVTEKLDKLPVTKRIIEVDEVDISSRCRASDSDEEKTEAARRFIDRVYPKGKSGA